jgi:HAMP domain-containing protein
MYVGCVDWGEKRAMWLEIGMGTLLVLALAQSAALLAMWRQSQRLQQRIERMASDTAHGFTDVPTSMLVAALGRVERQIRHAEQQPPPTRQSYELAQHLARDGAGLDQLVNRCGLSRDEARLVLQMHPAGS